MAGKEEKLRVYSLAKELAVKLTQAATNVENLPQPLAYIIVTTPIGMMADIMIGSNSKYMRRKIGTYCRAALRNVKCMATIEVMKEGNWITQDEYEALKEHIESLSKMLWGLVKNIRKSATDKVAGKNGKNAEEASERKDGNSEESDANDLADVVGNSLEEDE